MGFTNLFYMTQTDLKMFYVSTCLDFISITKHKLKAEVSVLSVAKDFLQ